MTLDLGGRASAAVRAAVPADSDALGRVSALAYAAAYRGVVPDVVLNEWIETAPEAWRAALEIQLAGDPDRAWVAERDGVILGYATTSPARDRWLPPPEGAGELTNLYLDPSVIGAGIGRLLYEHAVSDLQARGFHPLVVWAFRDNSRAHVFYQRMGLAIDVANHHWVLDGVPCPIVRFRADWSATPRT
jgi:GNAT superfamily N-acetyltransferase